MSSPSSGPVCVKQVLLSTQPREQVYLQSCCSPSGSQQKHWWFFLPYIFCQWTCHSSLDGPSCFRAESGAGVRTDLGLLRRGGRSYSRRPNLQTELRHRRQESGSGYLHQVPALYRPQEEPIFYWLVKNIELSPKPALNQWILCFVSNSDKPRQKQWMESSSLTLNMLRMLEMPVRFDWELFFLRVCHSFRLSRGKYTPRTFSSLVKNYTASLMNRFHFQWYAWRQMSAVFHSVGTCKGK